jgi:hypothetical protein
MSLADKRALAKQVQQERLNLYEQDQEEARTRCYAEYEAAVASKRSELLADQRLHGGAADVAMADRGILLDRWRVAWDEWHWQNPQIEDLQAAANRAFAEWRESRGPSPSTAAADRKLLRSKRRRSKKNLKARLEVVEPGWKRDGRGSSAKSQLTSSGDRVTRPMIWWRRPTAWWESLLSRGRVVVFTIPTSGCWWTAYNVITKRSK